MIDLSRRWGVLRFAELRRGEMVECFERLGRYEANGFSTSAYVFATHGIQRRSGPLDDWRTGEKLPRIEAQLCRLPREVFDMLPPDQHGLLFGRTMRAFARITRAVGVLTMLEGWHATTKGPRDDLPRDLSEAPGRGERLLMMLEHTAFGAMHWVNEIKREPTRLEGWLEETKVVAANGRLVNLVDWRS